MFLGNPHIERARLLMSSGRIKEAEDAVAQALKDDPKNDEALLLLAECKIESKEFDRAIKLLEECIHLTPDNDRIFYLYAFAYYSRDELQKAIVQLDEAIRLHPWQSSYFGLYAYILLELRRPKEALVKANEGLSVYAEDLTCLNARSKALYRLNDKEGAYETIREALDVNPEDDNTHANYGWNLLQQGKHQEALTHFREALRINPSNHYAREGFKQALKSKLAPYRAILMFSLWLSEKSKNARWGIIIVIYLAMKVLTKASDTAGFTTISAVIVGAYLLFVILSWIGNSVANLYLCLHPEGKHALTSDEKYNAYGVGTALFIAIAMAGYSFFAPDGVDLLTAGFVFLSLTLPLSRVEYPVDFSKFRVWATFLLIVFGLAAVANMFANPSAEESSLVGGYIIALMVYTWTVPAIERRY